MTRGLITAVFILGMAGAAHAVAGPECSQLRQLEQEYRGVQLTAYQQKVKAQLVYWYRNHCQGQANKVREAAKTSNWN